MASANWVITEPMTGFQDIQTTETVQKHPLGTRVRANHATYGEGAFVYLKGLAATAVGELVIYDNNAGTTTRATAGSRGPAGVAMSANVANQWGWYQVAGSGVIKSGAVAANANVYVTATAGTVDDAVVSGDKVDGARFKTADGTPAAGFATVQLESPSLNGNG